MIQREPITRALVGRHPRGAVDLTVPCREYPSRDRDYPRVRYNGRLTRVHRIAFLEAKGPLGPDDTVDHLCFNRHCIEPLHLEAVTLAENTHRAWVAGRQARGYAAKPGVSACLRGHAPEWGGNGSRGGPRCKACHRDQMNARRLRAVVSV